MEGGSKVTLVRCPKCENLLPELPDFSVYQCGGCGAVLRAKNQGSSSGGLLKKYDEEKSGENPEKGLGVGLENARESDSDGVKIGREKEEYGCEKTINLIDSSSSKTEDNGVVNEIDAKTRTEAMNLKHDQDQRNERGDTGYYDRRYKNCSRQRFSNLVHVDDHEVKTNRKRFECGNSFVESGNTAENRRFSTFSHPYDGSLKNCPDSLHDYAEHRRVLSDLGGLSRVKNLEHERAEILRKLDELKNQLGSSSDVREKPRDLGLTNRMMDNRCGGYNSYAAECPMSLYGVNMQPFPPDKDVMDPIYCNYERGRALNMLNSCPPRYIRNGYVGYQDSYLPNGVVRSSYQQPPPCIKQPYDDCSLGQQMGFNQGNFSSHVYESSLHRPKCSCLRCYKKNSEIPPTVPQPTDRSRLKMDPSNPIYDLVNSSTYGIHGYKFGGPRDFDLETGSFDHGRLRREVVAHKNGRICHPFAGGAPFMACSSCFELLKLPRKLTIISKKNQQEIQCGSCLAIISIQIEKKGIVLSIPTQIKKVSAEVDVGFGEALAEDVKSSDEYNNSAYNFQLSNVEPNVLSRGQSVKSGQSNEKQGPVSPSSSYSEDEPRPDSVIIQEGNSNCAGLPSKGDSPPSFPRSPHEEEADDDFSDYVLSRCGMGGKSKRTSRQNSVKDVPLVAEKEVIYSEFVDRDMAFPEEVSEEEDQLQIGKRSESFFAGFFKKSFKDLLKSSQSVEMRAPNIFVNGQHLSDRVVKKAEKFAGPIQPGNYWYDYQAGFWGVLGQPCHGIIPPFIEEFNIPMPENCAAGNTGVFVNGRELHETDLDLLAGRGLPTTRDKFYMIEISGRVVDECTGEELDGLGKLAPTVEKVKHGFGMKPRAFSQ